MTINRIRSVSRVMSFLCLIGMLGLPASLTLGWLFPELFGGAYTGLERHWGPPEELPMINRFLGLVVSMVPASLLIYGLARLRRMFRLYEAGEIFSTETALCLKQFGIAVMLQAILHPVAGAFQSVIVTFHNPPGERMLTLSFGSAEYSAALLGGLLLVIAWIMGQGAKLAEENRQFI